MKKLKWIMLILLSLVIASTVYIILLMNEKTLYKAELIKVEEELIYLIEEKEKLDSLITEQTNGYEETIHTISKLSDEINDKNIELTKKNNELLTQIEALEVEVKRNKDFLYNWPQASDFYMVYGSNIIWTGMDEKRVIELFGEPQIITTGLTETTIDSYNNRPTKKYEYEDFFVELIYISENHEDGYWVRLIVSKTDKLGTIRGIRVGDTEDYLLEKYPYLEVTFVNRDNENDKLYVMDNFMVRDSLTIHVKDGVVIDISVNFIYD